jgi:hypothetical protein
VGTRPWPARTEARARVEPRDQSEGQQEAFRSEKGEAGMKW